MTCVTANQLRLRSGWSGGYVEHSDGDTTLISVVFSWRLEKAIKRVVELLSEGKRVEIGGPAADYAGVSTRKHVGAVRWHNPNATTTSTGCVFNCGFCLVPKIEGDLKERESWDRKPVFYDNNITACSRRHFDRVIDSAKGLSGVEFNQGISAALLTAHHASRLAELDMKVVRLAWDNVGYESKFMSGWQKLIDAGFPPSKISVYILIGFHDTPDDALYRLESVRKLGSVPYPMRYQALDAPKRNSYVEPPWTNQELVRFCRYWSNLRIVRRIPFAEFQYPYLFKRDR